MKLPRNWVGEANVKKICMGNQKREGRENAKTKASCVFFFFIFIFSLLAMMVTNTVVRKSSLEDLFLKKLSLVFLITFLS